jgi:hypothetical protein
VAINGRVDSYGKDVLMVLSKSTGRDNIAVRTGLAGVDVDYGDDTGSPSLDSDAGGVLAKS